MLVEILPLRVESRDEMERSFGEDKKNRGPVSQHERHDKVPPPVKALRTEHRPKLCSYAAAMVTYPYE
jgi:hypothetical protein